MNPNQIVQNYLNDTSVNKAARQKTMEMLNSGQGTADQAAAVIRSTYGDKYNPTTGQVGGETATSLIKGFSDPINSIKTGVFQAAPTIQQNLSDFGSNIKPLTPKVKNPSDYLPSNMAGNLALDAMDTIGDLGLGAVKGITEGTGNIVDTTGQVLDVINPVNVFSKATGVGKPVNVAQTVTKPFKDLTKSASDNISKVQEELLKRSSQGVSDTLGRFIGEVGSEAAALAAGGGTVQSVNAGLTRPFINKFPKIAAALNFVLTSAETTGLTTAASEDRLPTAQELATYGAVDLALLGVSQLGSKLYRSAFKGTKGQEKNLVKEFNSTVADVAEKYGYTGSAEQIREKATEVMAKNWDDIVRQAQTVGEVPREKFEDMAVKIGKEVFGDLPESQIKSEAQQLVYDSVMKYAPAKSATGSDLVAILKNINRNLFGDGTRVVLSPKQTSSLEAALKDEIKNYFPDSMKESYRSYAENKLLSEVMANEQVKRAVGRMTIGAGVGGGAGLLHALDTGNDPVEAVKNIVGWAVGGAIVGALSANTELLTRGGKLLNSANNPITKMAVKSALERLELMADETLVPKKEIKPVKPSLLDAMIPSAHAAEPDQTNLEDIYYTDEDGIVRPKNEPAQPENPLTPQETIIGEVLKAGLTPIVEGGKMIIDFGDKADMATQNLEGKIKDLSARFAKNFVKPVVEKLTKK